MDVGGRTRAVREAGFARRAYPPPEMRRLPVSKRLVAVLAGLACAVAVAVLEVGGGATRVAQAAADAGAASNKAAARAAAARILNDVRLPAGATRVSADPGVSIWLKYSVAGVPATPDVVDYHRFWRVPGDPHAVIDWIEAHHPAGATTSSTGSESRDGAPVTWSVIFAFTGIVRGVSEEVLGVGVTGAKGGGTAIRADGLAVWLIPRPVAEVVPAGTRAVSVSMDQPGGRNYRVSTITAPQPINRLVALIDSLPRAQPGAIACPTMGQHAGLLDVRFLAASGGKPLARAVETGCGGLSFAIRGRTKSGLDAGTNLERLLWQLGALPACGVGQLAASATVPAGFPSAVAPVTQLDLRNTSGAVCSLEGFARLTLLGADRRALPTRAANSPNPPGVVILTPHTSAGINLSPALGIRSCRARRAAFIEAVIPGISRAFSVPVGSSRHPFAPCQGEIRADAIG